MFLFQCEEPLLDLYLLKLHVGKIPGPNSRQISFFAETPSHICSYFQTLLFPNQEIGEAISFLFPSYSSNISTPLCANTEALACFSSGPTCSNKPPTCTYTALYYHGHSCLQSHNWQCISRYMGWISTESRYLCCLSSEALKSLPLPPDCVGLWQLPLIYVRYKITHLLFINYCIWVKTCKERLMILFKMLNQHSSPSTYTWAAVILLANTQWALTCMCGLSHEPSFLYGSSDVQ